MSPVRNLLRNRRVTTSALHADHIRAAHACASWLIGYPDAPLVERFDGIVALADGLDPVVRDPLVRCATSLADLDSVDRCERYVETFDTRRRGCLYLTYYSSGDTRRRGMELLAITDTYRQAGLVATEDELPDHLSVVLQFSAATSLECGLEILNRHRPGIELLRTHLEASNSPWHGAVEAVSATLPRLSAAESEAMMALAANGPETETVGLDGYGNDLYDQIYPASRPGPTFAPEAPATVPMPTRRTERTGGDEQ